LDEPNFLVCRYAVFMDMLRICFCSSLEQSNHGFCVHAAHPFLFRLSLEQPQSPVSDLSAAMLRSFPWFFLTHERAMTTLMALAWLYNVLVYI